MNLKRFTCLSLSVVLTVMLAACGGSSSGGGAAPASAPAEASTGAPADASSPADTPAEPANAEYVMKLAHDHQVTSPFQDSSEWMKKEIEEKSGGRIAVEIYPAQQLGSSREMIEGMQLGTVEAVLLPTAKFGGFDQKLNLCDMPYLFPNEEALWEMLEGEVGRLAMADLPNIGMLGIQYFAEGWHFITSNKSIKTLEDMSGLKMRTMEAPIIMDTFSAWGANPVPIDFAEVYNSLQQNVVDGHENPIISVHDMKFYEVQKYLTQLNHGYLAYFLCYSKNWYEGLPEDLQKVVMQAGLDGAQYHKSLMQEVNDKYLQNIIDYGNTEIVYLTDEEAVPWREAVQPLYDKYRSMFGDELMDLALETMKKYQK